MTFVLILSVTWMYWKLHVGGISRPTWILTGCVYGSVYSLFHVCVYTSIRKGMPVGAVFPVNLHLNSEVRFCRA